MRIWSLHPSYLDTKGIVALWRETLLAKHVLEGRTKGYTNHPQLDRFKKLEKPVDAINEYLAEVYDEATRRGYKFDRSKIDWTFTATRIKVNTGQVDYEFSHLMKKLQIRDIDRFTELQKLKTVETHKMFEVVKGGVEDWEIV